MNFTSLNPTKAILGLLMVYGLGDPKQEERRRRYLGDHWQNKPVRKPHAGLKRSGTPIKGRLLLTDSESLPEATKACLNQIWREVREL